MKLDKLLQQFTETYDINAMKSIDDISKEKYLIRNKSTIKTFNIKEAFEKFNAYIEGYSVYKIKNKDNPKASSREAIRESVTRFIDTELFKEDATTYDKLPEFVHSYLEGVSTTISTIEKVKADMEFEDVDLESVGDVNDFADHFVDKLQESFDPVMNRILWGSGYNAQQRMDAIKNGKKISSTQKFL